MTISYDPSADVLKIELGSLSGKPSKVIEDIKLWWNDKGQICGITIADFMEKRRSLKACRNAIRLGGIWKDVRIAEQDIRDIRKSLLKNLEEKW
jgi:uncharacterized protein YuzE